MNIKKNTILFAFLYTAVMLILFIINPFVNLNYIVSDLLFQRPQKVQNNLFVIGIDDKTLQKIGPWHTWSREHVADMITLLNSDPENRPAVIGVDIMYFGNTIPKQDNALVEAAQITDNVVFASQILFDEKIKTSENGAFFKDNLHIVDVEEPFSPLNKIAPSGFTNVYLDSDGYTRKNILQVFHNGTYINNFAYKVYEKYMQKTNQSSVYAPPVNKLGMWYVPYSAKADTYGKGLSFIDIQNGTIQKEIFKDAIVLIGPYASGMLDSYLVPIDKSTTMYGVEVNANVIQALCMGNFKTEIPLFMQLIFSAICILLCFFIFKDGSVRLSVLIFFLFTFGYLSLAVILYHFGYIVNVIYIPIFTLLLYGYGNIQHYISEMNERILILNTFKRYVAPQFVDDIMKNKNPMSALGGVKRDIAVLFVDIRGFTPMSENLSPEEVVGILNEYLTLTSSMIFKNEGTVDKFIGDATMAIFNAPFDQKDYVYRAVMSAYDIAQGSAALEKRLMEKFGKTISFGIGVNCGEAVVGNIGAEFRMDYTAIGDTVNTAARLESNAKAGQILISQHVYDRLKERITVKDMGVIPLKGKSEPLNVYLLESILNNDSNKI